MDGHSHPYGGSGEGSGMVDIQSSTMERPLMDSYTAGDGRLHEYFRRGLGIVTGSQIWSGTWTQEERRMHIN